MDATLSEINIKHKVVSGVMILGIRRFFLQIIITVSNIILARTLSPQIFGLFAIISFLTLTLSVFTSFGLDIAMIQRKDKLTKDELRAIFTTLMVSSTIFIIVMYFFAPLANILYRGQLGTIGIYWLRLFAFTIVLDHASSISVRLLERKLAYIQLTTGEIFTYLINKGVTIFLAWKGFGLGSFVWGSLIGSSMSFVIFTYLNPWPINVNFSIYKIKKLLSYGINVQLNNLIGIANKSVVDLFVGAVSGPSAVGLINWAGGVRQAGLAPFEVMEKLILPVASRVQENKHLLKQFIENTIRLSCMLSFPLLAAIFAMAPAITSIVYTSQWLPGLVALYLFLIQAIFILIGTIMMDVLLALGQVGKVRNISIFWAILQWLLSIPLVLLWNFNGVVLAGVLVSLTCFIPIIEVQKQIHIQIWRLVWPWVFYSIIVGICMLGLTQIFMVDSVMKIITIGLTGGVLYWGIILAFHRQMALHDLSTFRKLVFAR